MNRHESNGVRDIAGHALSERKEGGARFQGGQRRSAPGEPLITIITATYNAAGHLPNVCQSIREQTYGNVEWIVVDGASKDGTQDILRQNEDVIDYWISEPDKGIYDAWNKGLRLARGEWICFLGADDFLWDRGVMKCAASVLAETPSTCRVVYGSVMLVSPSGNPILAVGEDWTPKLKRRFRQAMSIPHPGTFHRASLFRERGEFDASYRIAGDYELLLRELKDRDAFFIQDLITVGMTMNGVSSAPKNILASLREARLAQKQNGIGGMGPTYMLALFRAWTRVLLWQLAGESLARRLLDLGRRLMGKSPYWTKA